MHQSSRLPRPITVPAQGHGYPLNELLAAYFGNVNLNVINRGIKDGLAKCSSGDSLSSEYVVSVNERIELDLTAIARCIKPRVSLNVLYEDAEIVAVDKPAGVLVHPAGGLFKWTIIEQARLNWSSNEMDLCHRLDRETSGVLLLAKTKRSSAFYKSQFEARSLQKHYTAYVEPAPQWSKYDCKEPIGHAQDESRVRRIVRSDGRPANTRFRLLERFAGCAAISCEPITGRSHQIRVHLSHLGHPILGDALYRTSTSDEANDGQSRHALHCDRLEIRRVSGESLVVKSPIPKDMIRLLDECRDGST